MTNYNYSYSGELTLSRELNEEEIDMLNFVLGKRIDDVVSELDSLDGNYQKSSWMDLDWLDFTIMPDQTIVPLQNPEGTSEIGSKVEFLVDYISIVMDNVVVNGTVTETSEIDGDEELELTKGILTTKITVTNSVVSEDSDIES